MTTKRLLRLTPEAEPFAVDDDVAREWGGLLVAVTTAALTRAGVTPI
jgi:hypothetical protein